MYANSWVLNDGDKNQQKLTLGDALFMLVSNPIDQYNTILTSFFWQFKGHGLGINTMQLHILSQPVISLTKCNFTIIY